MLKTANRLTKKKDFDRVFKQGASSYNEVVGCKQVDNNTKNSRFGIIVSLKVSKKAVERNKIKRRIREIIKSELDKIQDGKDFVIVVLPKITEKNFGEIKKSIVKNFEKLGVYNKAS